MSFSIGIVGLPNVGKSTIFKALTKKNIDIANYPFCTIDPNIGIVEIPDSRLKKLSEISKSKKIIPTVIEFFDIAGLVKGASKGEGLGNKFLSNIKQVDAICHVVRFFDGDTTHVSGEKDPKRDADVINLELILSDLELINKRLQAEIKNSKSGNKEVLFRIQVYKKIKDILENEEMLNRHKNDFSEDELKEINLLNLLTIKPMFFVANISEDMIGKELAIEGYDYKIFPISAKIESEISEIENEEEKNIFLEELGLKESGLSRIIKFSYDLLNLITYFTSGEQETRAWTIENGINAKKSASKIHSDIEEGFIRAEIVSYKDFVNNDGWSGVKNAGVCRTEGKDYIVKDGDVIFFLFKK
ncbi:redox-regulated ATPase YchF [Patescibacteria group bacterium]|nr:redox-regulated ATPase YchF [Patescibacteria group bacterium]